MQNILSFQWLEDSLTRGVKTSEDSFRLELELEKGNELNQPSEAVCCDAAKGVNSDDKDDEASSWKKTRTSEHSEATCVEDKRGTSHLERNYLITPEHQLADINVTQIMNEPLQEILLTLYALLMVLILKSQPKLFQMLRIRR